MFPISGLIDIVPNTYYISSYGRVITKLKTRENSFIEMTIQKNKSNYNRYVLNGIENKINSYKNSKLVACYFTPIDYTNPLFYLDKYADNIDGDEDNNHWSNLEWIDTKDVSLLKGGKVAMKQFMLDDFNKMVEKKRSRIRESSIEEYNIGLELSNHYLFRLAELSKEIFKDLKLNNLSYQEIIDKYKVSEIIVYRIDKLIYPFDMILKG